MKNYKRDSTRGRAPMIDPISYKPDIMVQVWIDARKIVMLDKWLEDHGIRNRFMSDVVRETLDIVLEQLLESGGIEKVEYSKIAHDTLKWKFKKSTLNPGERGKRNIAHNLHLDERRKGKGRGIDEIVDTVPTSSISNEEYDKVMEDIRREKEEEARSTASRAKPGPSPTLNPEYVRTTDQRELHPQQGQNLQQQSQDEGAGGGSDSNGEGSHYRHEWRKKGAEDLDKQEERIKERDKKVEEELDKMLKDVKGK